MTTPQLYVILIDDKSEINNLFSQMLKTFPRVGKVFTCTNLEDAKVVVRQNPVINIAILDLYLEKTSGLSTLKEFKKLFPFLPAVVITGYDPQGLSYSCFEHGAADFLTKPEISPPLLYKSCIYALEKDHIRRTAKTHEDTLHSLLDVAPIGIAMLVERQIKWVNDYLCKMVGREKQELEGEDARVLYPNLEEYERVGAEKYPAIALGEKGIIESKWQTRSGEVIDVLIGSAAVGPGSPSAGVISTALDITERKQLARRKQLIIQALKLLNKPYSGTQTIEELLKLVQESTGIEAVAIRLQDGTDYPYFVYRGFGDDFIKMENLLCAMDDKGCPELDQLGQPVLDCMCGCVIRGHTNTEIPCFTENGSFWTNSTTELLSKKSSILPDHPARNKCNMDGYESVAIIPLKVEDEIIGSLQLNDKRKYVFSNSFIDALEELAISIAVAVKRAWQEDRIKNLEVAKTKDLLRSSRLLNSGIAHELRTPMQALLNCLELIKEEMEENCCSGCVSDKNCNLFNTIVDLANDGINRTEYSVKVLNSLSEYSKIATGEEVHLINVVPELKTIMRTLLFTDQFKSVGEENFTLQYEDTHNCFISINRVDFSQLITNLCRNALEAVDHDDPKILIFVKGDTNRVSIKVLDNGRGLDSSLGDKIFEPYFSTKDNPDNYNQGLGLAMVRDIIKAYKGDISYSSRPGKTVFTITLPCERID